jgi:hypothetical protein
MKVPPGLARFDGEFMVEVLALNTLCQPNVGWMRCTNGNAVAAITSAGRERCDRGTVSVNSVCGRGPELAQATATPSVVAIQQFAVCSNNSVTEAECGL